MRSAIFILGILLQAATVRAEDLIVYSPHGAEIRDDLVPGFEAAHPGVRVRWLDMGAAEVLERIRAERTSPRAHVWWGAPATFFMLAAEEGLLRPYRPTWADQAPPYARGKNDAWFGQFDLPIGIGHVPGRIPETELPKAWDDLTDLDAPGRLLLRDPPASGTMKTFLASMILRAGDAESGLRWLSRLHERTHDYAATPVLLFQKLARGEGDLTVWNVADLLFQKARYDYPFAVILPEEGVPVITDSIALVAGAGETAEAFYEYVTSVASSLRLAEEHFRIPVRRDLPEDRLPAWLETIRYRPLSLDRSRLVTEMEGWTARWETEVRAAGSRTAVPWFAWLAAGICALTVGLLLAGRRRRRTHEDV